MAISLHVTLLERAGDSATYAYRDTGLPGEPGLFVLRLAEPIEASTFEQVRSMSGERGSVYCERALVAVVRHVRATGSLPSETSYQA